MFSNMKVGAKLAAGFSGAMLILILVAAVGYSNIRSIAMKGDALFAENTKSIEAMGIVNAAIEKMRGDIYRYIAVPVERSKTAMAINEQISIVNDAMKGYRDKANHADEKKMIAGFDAAWPEMQRGYLALMKAADDKDGLEVDRLLADGSYVIQARKSTLAAVRDLNEFNRTAAEATNTGNKKAASSSSLILLLSTFLGVVVAAFLGVVLTRSITIPLSRGVGMMKELGSGHLSSRLNMTRKDELGILAQAMDEFADDLQNNVVALLKKVAAGDLSTHVIAKDAKDEISPALIDIHKALNGMILEMQALTQAALKGQLAMRGKAENYRGGYHEIIKGVNDTLDAMLGPINEAAQTLEKMAAKDMSVRVKGEYLGDLAKIKDSLNLAAENLDKALQQVAIGADQVAAASVQVSTGGQSLSQGANEQASSLEEISSSLQEMTSMTRQNATNAKEAKGVAETTKSTADKGMESMGRLSEAINKIKSSSDATAKIVKTIDEIAFQTNLLALNAAVEAARAGDAGKGFAVVAEEVRNLAMRSADAAKNTANLIEEAVKNSQNGVQINSEAMTKFKDINEKANKMSEMVAEIAAASEQQDQGILQLNKAVEQMNQITQQNAANAEESASSAEEMSSQAEEMRSMVAGFKLTVSNDFLQNRRVAGASVPAGFRSILSKKGGNGGHLFGVDPSQVIPLEEKDRDVLKKF
jgi:methyl-accepting chemotaxis protein